MEGRAWPVIGLMPHNRDVTPIIDEPPTHRPNVLLWQCKVATPPASSAPELKRTRDLEPIGIWDPLCSLLDLHMGSMAPNRPCTERATVVWIFMAHQLF